MAACSDIHHLIRMCSEVLKGVLQSHNTVQELFSRLKWPRSSLHCCNAHGRDIKQTLTLHLIKWGLSTVSLSVLTQCGFLWLTHIKPEMAGL